jgi:isoamylase
MTCAAGSATVEPGRSFPLGATPDRGGVNFSVFAKNCEVVELCLFDNVGDDRPARVLALDPETHRTYHYWHAFVPRIAAGQLYGYRAHGPFEPDKGLRFDPEKLLVDPYARCVAPPPGRSRAAACGSGDNTQTAYKCVVADPCFDWENDRSPRTPFAKTIIYEMHVGAFTRNPNSGVAAKERGTFAGVAEKIPYLRDLGITTVELLPVFAFDEEAAPAELKNVWGYQPVAVFAPHPAYGSSSAPLGVLDEFRQMVKAFHASGIEVILDVVYNHTAEGGGDGPTLSLRGLANDVYYILDRNPANYADYTGCGNTLDANESIVRRMILDSLRYWVSEMHVDGFRFDLASVLSRDEDGAPMARPPILWDIESDPVLSNVKLIAEAWDAAGLYQVGSFAGESWKEWNGKFRDDVRAFVKADNGKVGSIAARLIGSPDIYAQGARDPERSINFVSCHDGFTLNDLVSYNEKHNVLNGEGGRDGSDQNLSWNCGVEGPTGEAEIERLRNRQVKNFLALTLLSVGTPMLLMGDELRRTQNGNNNAYCQDDETTWFDWSLLNRHHDVFRFVKELVSLRKGRALAIEREDLTLNELLARNFVEWHGVRLKEPDWGTESHSLAATVYLDEQKLRLHLMINAYWEPLSFELPAPSDGYGSWRRCLDTALDAPDDICAFRNAFTVEAAPYRLERRSVAVLASR